MSSRFPFVATLLPVAALVYTSIFPTGPGHAAKSPLDRPVETMRICSTLPALSPEALVKSSNRIVRATVRSVTPFRFRPGWISRRVTLDIHECWKGESGSVETILLHGGRMGDSMTLDANTPDVAIGEEWVFYLQSVGGLEETLLAAGTQAAGKIGRDRSGAKVVAIGGGSVPLSSLKARDERIVKGGNAETQTKGEVR